MTFERNFFQYLENLKNRLRAQPLFLGGVSSSGGGVGGPPGGFVGMLPQSRVTYDKLEEGTASTPESGATLLDNLNHIRQRLEVIEASGSGGISEVQDDSVLVVSNATILNFEGGNTVTADGSTAVIESPI